MSLVSAIRNIVGTDNLQRNHLRCSCGGIVVPRSNQAISCNHWQLSACRPCLPLAESQNPDNGYHPEPFLLRMPPSPDWPVVVLRTAIDSAAPVGPAGPTGLRSLRGHRRRWPHGGMTKSKARTPSTMVSVTDACSSGSAVVVLRTAILPAVPAGPWGQSDLLAPVAPMGPVERGTCSAHRPSCPGLHLANNKV